MKIDNYSFQKLDEETKKDWMTVSLNCSYAWLDVVNKEQVKQKIENPTSVNLVLYNKNKDPVAIYSSRQIANRKYMFLNVRVLEAHFNGLFIADKFHHLFVEIRDYFLIQLVGYFKNELKIDVIEHFPPPSLTVTHPDLVHHQSLPTKMNLSKNDSLVTFDLSGSVMETLKSKVRNEIRRGIKSIGNNNYHLITDKKLILSRHDKPIYYARNGPGILIIDKKKIISNELYDGTTKPYIMDYISSIDIDNKDDLIIANAVSQIKNKF